MSVLKGCAAWLAIGGMALLSAGAAARWAGARVNATRSLPLGLYWTSGAPVVRGAHVVFCPPPRAVFEEAKRRHYIGAGFCPGGYGYLMKKVVAMEGDTVVFAADGVRVNGALVRLSAAREADGTGRPLPRVAPGARRLKEDEVLLMSDVSARSFDGRYFGLVSRAQIRAVIVPVLTW